MNRATDKYVILRAKQICPPTEIPSWHTTGPMYVQGVYARTHAGIHVCAQAHRHARARTHTYTRAGSNCTVRKSSSSWGGDQVVGGRTEHAEATRALLAANEQSIKSTLGRSLHEVCVCVCVFACVHCKIMRWLSVNQKSPPSHTPVVSFAVRSLDARTIYPPPTHISIGSFGIRTF